MSRGQAASAASTAARAEAYPANALNAAFDRALRRFLGWAVFLITGGYTFLDYWNYSRTFHEGGGEWEALLAGRSFAPAQYRIGVVRTADLLARLTHTHLRHMFAVIDFVCLGLSLVLLLWLLGRMEMIPQRGAARTLAAGEPRSGLFPAVPAMEFLVSKAGDAPDSAAAGA